MCSSGTAAFSGGMTARTAAQTLLGSSATRLAEKKLGSFTFPNLKLFQNLGRKFCLGLAQPIPAALWKEEVSGGSFMSNECQTCLLSSRGFEREKPKHFFSTWRHLASGCSGCLQRPSCTSQQQGSLLGGYSWFWFSRCPGAEGSLPRCPCNRRD